MSKERIAKWKFDLATNTISLFKAGTEEEVANRNLAEVWPILPELPEALRFFIQYGVKQKCADPDAGTKGADKLVGMATSLANIENQTFASATRDKTEYIRVSKKEANAQVYSLAELRMAAANPVFNKMMTDEMKAKLIELEAAATEANKKAAKK